MHENFHTKQRVHSARCTHACITQREREREREVYLERQRERGLLREGERGVY